MGQADQGVLADRYQVIPRVLVFAQDDEARLLLLKGAPDKKIWAGLWNGVGGHVERGESLPEAARREFQEETGLLAGSWQFCGQVLVDTGQNPGIAFFIFKAARLEGIAVNSSEGELGWFSLEEALNLHLVEDLYTLLPLILAQKPSDPPLWGMYRYDGAGQLIMSFSS